jgi:ribonuclease P protein component
MLRLQSTTDFERVRRDGRSHAHPLVVLIADRRPSEQDDETIFPPSRCGFAAGRPVGKAARRNRAKRLLREAVRVRAALIAPGWDLIFIARAGLAGATLKEAQAAVDSLLRRARVWNDHG